jgi:SAM-dependent methyltransferase
MNKTPRDLYGLEPSRWEDYARMDLEVIRRRWNSKAARWDDDLADPDCHLNADEGYRRFLDAAESVIDAKSDFCRSRKMVDLGCGAGAILERFAGRFYEGLGVDISEAMLQAARSKAIPHSRWINGNAFEISRLVNDVGAVFSRGILLSHYGDKWISILLKEIHSSLTPGGFVLLDFLNARARDNYPANPDNKSYYLAEDILARAREIGLVGEKTVGEPNRRVLFLYAERSSP